MTHLLRLASALLVGLLAVACSAAPAQEPTPSVDAEAVDELHARMADVARAQAEADRELAAAVEAVRQLDSIIGGLRDPGRVDEAKESWPRVEAAWTAASTDGLREGLVELAESVDEARLALNRVREQVSGDEWPAAYLDAEDEVLRRTRAYAETADELARALVRYWPTYQGLYDRTARFVEQRWFYRTSQEAADAYELAVQPLLSELSAAQGSIADARDARDEAAREVNEAVASARGAWADRDPASPSPSG